MYVLGFPAVKSVNAHSFQKIGTQKRAVVNLASGDPATYSVEDSLFGTIEFHKRRHSVAGNVICTQHPRTVDYERQLLW